MTLTALMPKNVRGWVQTNRKDITRFLKFAVVGALGALVDFGVFNLISLLFDMDTLPANVISFTTAVCSNFIWNRYWTYPDSRAKPLGRQLIQFFAVNLVGLGINTTIVLLLKSPMTGLLVAVSPALGLSFVAATQEQIGKNMAKVVATGVVMFWNFFINRIWTYNDVK